MSVPAIINNEISHNSGLQSSFFIYIKLDATYYIAGEKLTGEILLNLPEKGSPSKIQLNATGLEFAKITKSNGQVSESKNDVFHMTTTLVQWDNYSPSGQFVFPFSFKLPHYAPSSFDFDDTNSDGHRIQAKIEYKIEASFEMEGQKPLTDQRIMTIFNRNTRVSRQYSVNSTKPLVSCFCVKRGASAINLCYQGSDHSQIGKTSKFRLGIDHKSTQAPIISIVGQLLFELTVQIPGDKTYNYTNLVCRNAPNLQSLPHIDSTPKEMEYEANLANLEFGNNVSTNETGLIQAMYKAQVFVLYDVGCRTKRSEAALTVHVNPKVIEERKIELPTSWEPKESSISNLILEACNGLPIGSAQQNSCMPKHPMN